MAGDMPSPPRLGGSPDRAQRKRAGSEADKPKYQSPPPSYSTIATAAQTLPNLLAVTSGDPDQEVSPSLEPAVDLAETLEVQRPLPESDALATAGAEAELEKSRSQSGSSASADDSTAAMTTASNQQQVVTATEDAVTQQQQHPGAMNGSAMLGDGLAAAAAAPAPAAEVLCSVERAEEIMGTEALGLGLSMGLGLSLGGGGRLEDFSGSSIPVEHAVAVECDDQVLGELDTAGLEEFSRRIYALNENMPSFRRPRKNSDK